MDLSNFQVNDTTTVDLLNPVTNEILQDDQGDPMTITVASPDSKEAKRFDHEYLSRYMKESAKKGSELTPQEQESLVFEKFVSLTTDWHIQLGGEYPKCDKEKVKEIYTKYPFIFRQVQEAFGQTENFIQIT